MFDKIADLGKHLISSLPPAFLILIALNGAFLAVVMWFLDRQLDIRAALLGKIIDHCLGK